MEGGGGDVWFLGAAEDGSGGVVEFDAALVGEVDLEGGGVVGRENLKEGDEVVGGVGEVDALGVGDGDGFLGEQQAGLLAENEIGARMTARRSMTHSLIDAFGRTTHETPLLPED